jgi:hypothetical protein
MSYDAHTKKRVQYMAKVIERIVEAIKQLNNHAGGNAINGDLLASLEADVIEVQKWVPVEQEQN